MICPHGIDSRMRLCQRCVDEANKIFGRQVGKTMDEPRAKADMGTIQGRISGQRWYALDSDNVGKVRYNRVKKILDVQFKPYSGNFYRYHLVTMEAFIDLLFAPVSIGSWFTKGIKNQAVAKKDFVRGQHVYYFEILQVAD